MMPAASSVLLAIELARLLNAALNAYQSGRMSDEEFDRFWDNEVRVKVRASDDRWQRAKEADAARDSK